MEKETKYDKVAVGNRLKEKRRQLKWTRREVARKIGLTEKYYSDIERGSCGMSLETLISLATLYGFSLDSLIFGEEQEDLSVSVQNIFAKNLERLTPEKQSYCLQMFLLLIEGIDSSEKTGV